MTRKMVPPVSSKYLAMLLLVLTTQIICNLVVQTRYFVATSSRSTDDDASKPQGLPNNNKNNHDSPWLLSKAGMRSSQPTRGHHRHQPTIGMGKRLPFSDHFCVGPILLDNSNDKQQRQREMTHVFRSCHFTDVCFRSDGTLEYYHDTMKLEENDTSATTKATEESLQTILHGQDYWKGPDHTEHHKNQKIYQRKSNQNHQWMLRPKLIPHTRACTLWSDAPVAIPYLPSHVRNFGHNLMDNVYSFYRLLRLFDLYTDELDFIPLRVFGSDYYPDHFNGTTTAKSSLGYPPARSSSSSSSTLPPPDNISTALLSKILDPFLGQHASSSTEQAYFPTYFQHFNNNNNQHEDCLCFENVVTGKYMHTDHGLDETHHGWEHGKQEDSSSIHPNVNPHLIGKGDLVRDFRDAYMIRMGLDPYAAVHADSTAATPRILILPRPPHPETTKQSRGDRNKAIGYNHSLLMDHLINKTSYKSVQILHVETLSFLEQIQLVSSCNILISMRGGSSLLSIFLPPGATLILLDRGLRQEQFDDMLYDNIPYFHIRSIPATNNYSSTSQEQVNPNEFHFDYNKLSHQIETIWNSYKRANLRRSMA